MARPHQQVSVTLPGAGGHLSFSGLPRPLGCICTRSRPVSNQLKASTWASHVWGMGELTYQHLLQLEASGFPSGAFSAPAQ